MLDASSANGATPVTAREGGNSAASTLCLLSSRWRWYVEYYAPSRRGPFSNPGAQRQEGHVLHNEIRAASPISEIAAHRRHLGARASDSDYWKIYL